MNSNTPIADVQLAQHIRCFYADPFGFAMYAYPRGQPGMLEHHDRPGTWQKDKIGNLCGAS